MQTEPLTPYAYPRTRRAVSAAHARAQAVIEQNHNADYIIKIRDLTNELRALCGDNHAEFQAAMTKAWPLPYSNAAMIAGLEAQVQLKRAELLDSDECQTVDGVYGGGFEAELIY